MHNIHIHTVDAIKKVVIALHFTCMTYVHDVKMTSLWYKDVHIHVPLLLLYTNAFSFYTMFIGWQDIDISPHCSCMTYYVNVNMLHRRDISPNFACNAYVHYVNMVINCWHFSKFCIDDMHVWCQYDDKMKHFLHILYAYYTYMACMV